MSKTVLIILLLLIVSCSYVKRDAEPEAVAKVGDSWLYKEDIKGLVPPETTKEDSAVIIKNYIDRWASQKLLINAAEINLSEAQKASLDELVRQYKVDLYTKAYIEDIVKTTVDTVISDEELEDYYRSNKENFRTNGVLVKLRYIQMHKANPKYETVKSKFFDFRKTDKKFWDASKLQFKSFAFNDSVWVDMSQVYSHLPFINPDNRDEFISAGKSVQHADGDDMYLVKIVNVIDRNQISPFEYLKPTLREVILNKRKLELIKKFEKDITDDAIKDNKYEIYK